MEILKAKKKYGNTVELSRNKWLLCVKENFRKEKKLSFSFLGLFFFFFWNVTKLFCEYKTEICRLLIIH